MRHCLQAHSAILNARAAVAGSAKSSLQSRMEIITKTEVDLEAQKAAATEKAQNPAVSPTEKARLQERIKQFDELILELQKTKVKEVQAPLKEIQAP